MIFQKHSWHSQLRSYLASYRPPHNPHVSQQAAVLIPVFEKLGEPWILLTQRSQRMRSHPGEVAFPGGRSDSNDRSLEHTLFREVYEEIGICEHQIEVMGEIDQILSKNRLLVTPFIGYLQVPFSIQQNPHEVDAVFEVPLSFFLDPTHHESRLIPSTSLDTPSYLVHYFDFEGYLIWGMTALLILQFLQIGFRRVPSYPIQLETGLSWAEWTQSYRDQSHT